MLLVVLTVEGGEGVAHPKMDEVQAKFDCLLGISGDNSCEIYHDFPYRCEFYQWVHIVYNI